MIIIVDKIKKNKIIKIVMHFLLNQKKNWIILFQNKSFFKKKFMEITRIIFNFKKIHLIIYLVKFLIITKFIRMNFVKKIIKMKIQVNQDRDKFKILIIMKFKKLMELIIIKNKIKVKIITY